jgi:hypothetical protein
MEVMGTTYTTGLGSGWYSFLVPLSPASLHQEGVFLRRTVVADSPLHAPHQPSDLTLTKLIMLSIWRRKPKATKPVAAIVMQVMGNFDPEIFKSPMFRDVISVCICRLGGPNGFGQSSKTIFVTIVLTTMQTMSYPVRSLCSPPDIALECVCQAALGFPAS